ncbi:MAG: hypothetical protein K2Z81_06235, partial [Cyanobacteria bacterium]|nr:hypothetical protein [Cyanobacteriota bacterium]
RQEFPDLKEGLAQAVVKGYQESSRDPIVAFLAESAKNNPDLARQLKEIIGDALRPNQDADTQRLGVSMLLAMSSQWTQDDFFKAVAFLKPDQVSQFRQAIAQAPPEVSKAYTDILRDPTGRLQQQLEEQLPGFGAIKPFGQEQQPDWFKARLQFIASMDARSRGYEIPGMDFLTPAAKDDPFGLLLGRDRNDPAALLTDPFGTKRDSRRDEPYEELFRKAWPDERWRDQSYGRTGRDKTDTTAYLAAGLDRGIFDSDTAVSPQKLFDSWGVKDPSLASSIDEAAAKYGMEALLQLDRRIQLYNSLDPATREELTGKREPVSEAEIAGVILNGRLGAEGTAGAFLMGNPPLEQKFAELLAKTSSDL